MLRRGNAADPRRGRSRWAELAARGCRGRVLMPTAAGTTDDLVDGLARGADDHVAKPFDLDRTDTPEVA